jgi:16S rRNA processing protein RimM
MSDESMVVIGQVSGLFGVRGWIKVYSYTDPREGILNYSPWYLKRSTDWVPYGLRAGQRHGRGILAQLQGIEDRDQAAELMGCQVAVRRKQLPELHEGEYYWNDLQGLRVENLDGVELGRISYLFETGANEVIVVKGRRE